jgi:hypothetical protein
MTIGSASGQRTSRAQCDSEPGTLLCLYETGATPLEKIAQTTAKRIKGLFALPTGNPSLQRQKPTPRPQNQVAVQIAVDQKSKEQPVLFIFKVLRSYAILECSGVGSFETMVLALNRETPPFKRFKLNDIQPSILQVVCHHNSTSRQWRGGSLYHWRA